MITAEPLDRRSPSRGSTSRSATPGLQALGVPERVARRASPRSSAPAWRRARTCSATSARARPSSWEAPFRDGAGARAGDDQRQGPGRARSARRPAARARSSAAAALTVVGLPGRRRAARAGASTSATPTASPSRRSRAAASTAAGPGRAAARTDGWRPLRAGEFILGYQDEQGALPPAPPPDELRRQRLLPRLPQAAPGRRGVPPRCSRDAAAPLPGRRGAAGRQDRRPLARRHAARPLPRPPGPRARRRPAAQQRVRLRATTRTACAARSARTSGARTRAAACRSTASS